jgi:DNA gyrase subunit A
MRVRWDVRRERSLLVVSQNGYGKATKVANFPSHKRGGIGIKAAVVTAKTGPIIAVRTLEEDASEVLLISSRGQAIRVGLKDIPTLGRTTQGVRIMKMREGDAVASLGLMPEQPKDEEVEEQDA